MTPANIYLGLMQEKNITSGVYVRELEGYRVVASDVTSQHRRGMTLFYRDPTHLTVEVHQHNSTNIFIFQLEMWGMALVHCGVLTGPG